MALAIAYVFCDVDWTGSGIQLEFSTQNARSVSQHIVQINYLSAGVLFIAGWLLSTLLLYLMLAAIVRLGPRMKNPSSS